MLRTVARKEGRMGDSVKDGRKRNRERRERELG